MKKVIMAALAGVAVAAAHGAGLTVEIVRQDGHMTSEQAPLAVKDGQATFRLARKSLPADVKWVRVRPDFACAKAGVLVKCYQRVIFRKMLCILGSDCDESHDGQWFSSSPGQYGNGLAGDEAGL